MKSLFTRVQRPDLAIDLGTANTRIVTAGDGIIFDEPSICCFAGLPSNGKLKAIGFEAASMVGYTVADMRIVRPLSRGVLYDIDAARQFLQQAITKSMGTRRTGGFTAIIGVPIDATKAERNALMTAASDAGLKSVQLREEPLAAASGVGVEINAPTGTLLVECGAGITEAAILSLGGICGHRSLRMGGDALDQAIIDHLHSHSKFQIGEATAERVKRQLLERLQINGSPSSFIEVKGLNMLTGLPETMPVPIEALISVAKKHVGHIVEIVMDLLYDAPPELSRDIHANGIILTGGSASVELIGKALTESTGLRSVIASHEKNCVAEGLLNALRH